MRGRISGKALANASKRGAFILWDTETKGLYARRQTKAGRITYGFRYTDATGKKREVKLASPIDAIDPMLAFLRR